MRRALWLAAAAAITLIPASGLCQQQEQQTSAPALQQPAKQDDSLAAAARRSREQKKDAAKPARVFDNDNIPTKGGVSTVGNTPPAAAAGAPGAADATSGATPADGTKLSGGDEKSWRKRFADLRRKVEADQQELEILQRELGVLDLQNYNDPVKGMQQELTRSDINDKRAKIEAKKKQIAVDQQAISDAENELRKSGGDPGWAR